MAIKLPMKCKECIHVGDYTSGCYRRNPHYCCELVWQLLREDYKVDPDTIDENCPLKNVDLLKGIESLADSTGIQMEGFVRE